MPGRKDSLTPGAYFMVPTYLFREAVTAPDEVETESDPDTTAAAWLEYVDQQQHAKEHGDTTVERDVVINMCANRSAVDNRLWMVPSRTDDTASTAGTITVEVWGRLDDSNSVRMWMLYHTFTDKSPRTFNEIVNLPAGFFTLRVTDVSEGTWRIDVSKTGM